MADRRDFDVVVAGGGLVGASAALALARLGHGVALVDRGEPHLQRGALGFDLRTVALNPASIGMLDELGVWQELEHCPFTRVYVWEELGTRHIEFDAAAVDRAALGAIVEVSPAIVALWRAIEAERRVTLFTGGSIEGVTTDARGTSLKTTLGDVHGRLLLAADGAESSIRKALGIGTARHATGHKALITVARTEQPHQDTAWQIFRADGPVALLPLPSRGDEYFVSVVWSQLVAAAEARLALDDSAFAIELERVVESRLGAIVSVDRRHALPLEQRVAESFQPVPGVILIGDAARVLHPLAGQGVNLGFEDVAGVVDVVRRRGIDGIGGDDAWRAYARRRRTRAQLMVAAMDAFRVAYAIRDPGMAWLRNVSVAALNQTPLLKRALMREALGLH